MDTSEWGTDTGKFYPEPVRLVRTGAGLAAVERQSSSALLTVAYPIALAN